MDKMQPNPALERVRHELRTSGVSPDTPTPLRSGVHARGYLPHVKREGASYFITMRLVDSLPQEVLLQFKRQQAEQLRVLPNENQAARQSIDLELQRQIERYLDRGMGACHLRRPAVANGCRSVALLS